MPHVERDVGSDVKLAESLLTDKVSVELKIAVTSMSFKGSLTLHNFFICQSKWNALALTWGMFVLKFHFQHIKDTAVKF